VSLNRHVPAERFLVLRWPWPNRNRTAVCRTARFLVAT